MLSLNRTSLLSLPVASTITLGSSGCILPEGEAMLLGGDITMPAPITLSGEKDNFAELHHPPWRRRLLPVSAILPMFRLCLALVVLHPRLRVRAPVHGPECHRVL